MAVKNKVQLITYPDSLGGDLKTLNAVLDTRFPGVFEGGIHILPPFPSSGDRGFAPLNYLEIEPQFGTWEDIRRIGEKQDVLLDLMVNHISAKSKFFQDFLKNGRDSKYADLFITIDKIWPDGQISPDDFKKIFLRRTEPYSDFTVENTGETVRVWTTFGKVTPSEQIDLDTDSPATRELLSAFLENFSQNNVRIVRLDAVGYIIKKPGTSFFFVEPEIYDFLNWITGLANSLHIELLPEMHSHYSIQQKLSAQGYWIYDFILSYRVLETLIVRDSVDLVAYLKERPHKQFTLLDCHDGVPIKPDLDDLYDSAKARKVVDTCVQRGSNLSLIYADEYKDPDGFDVHQIRGTYYSMLGENDDAYIAARVIQFFTPGIPQVYYVGLLAGENDLAVLEQGGEGRDINRHNFSLPEIDQALEKNVVKRLLNLIHFRNEYPAFDGEFSVLASEPDEIHLMWEKGKSRCSAFVDLATYKVLIDFVNEDGENLQYVA